MEADVFEILLRHHQNVIRLRQEDIPPLFIVRHVLVFSLLELL